MKKKGRPSIPDFSKKRPSVPVQQDAKPHAPMRAAPVPTVKPHSTSMKSGRRGS